VCDPLKAGFASDRALTDAFSVLAIADANRAQESLTPRTSSMFLLRTGDRRHHEIRAQLPLRPVWALPDAGALPACRWRSQVEPVPITPAASE